MLGNRHRKCKPLIERFWQHVHKTEKCWLWRGATAPGGYGKIGFGQKTLRANRVSWEIHNGEIPPGMFVCHSCDNPSCVNPEHLWIGTARENTQDMVRKGRLKIQPQKGIKNPKAKLTQQQVNQIRAMYLAGKTIKILALLYSVHLSTIERIVKYQAWKE